MKKFILITALIISGCVKSTAPTSVKDIIKFDDTLVYDVKTEYYKGNHRLKLFAKNPKSIVYWAEENDLIISVGGVTDQVDVKLMENDDTSPCKYINKTAGSRLNYRFECQKIKKK